MSRYPSIFRIATLECEFSNTNLRRQSHYCAYQLAKLLVQPVTCPATGFFVRYLGSYPTAKVLFVFLGELSPPARVMRVTWFGMTSYVLFAWPSAAGVLVHKWRIENLTFLDAFLYPKIRLDVLVGNALICLDKMLEYFRIWICQDN